MSAPDRALWLVTGDSDLRERIAEPLANVGIHVRAFVDGASFLATYRPRHPEAVILDTVLPDIGGLAVRERLEERGCDSPVIFVSGFDDVALAVRAMRAGAAHFLEKPVRDHEILDAVLEALERDAAEEEWREYRSTMGRRLARLSDREDSILDLLVRGKSSKEIAHELGISKKTVDAYRGRLLEKLGASTVVELVAMTVPVRAVPVSHWRESRRP